MKKISIADVKASEILSKEERKLIIGGSGTCWVRGNGCDKHVTSCDRGTVASACGFEPGPGMTCSCW